MVDLKEVRVGNYVHHKDDWSYRQVGNDFQEFDFAWDYKDFHALLECTLYPEAIEFIDVTEQWLLKFGFKKVEDFDCYHNVYQLKGFKVSLDDYINVFVDWVEEGDSVRCYEELHVHTLQNLYFELMSKEELTFKD